MAEPAQHVFLVAHTAVLALVRRWTIVDVKQAGWVDRLPTGLDDAFVQFLEGLDAHKPGGLSSATTHAVLLALAFAEGEGLPWADLWAPVATAISDSPFDNADIALVREHAAPFIVEALESDRSVYRLYHERVAEYIRESVDSRQAEHSIVEALRSRVPIPPEAKEPDWSRAHPYHLSHLASHAFKAGMIDELIADGIFLAAANPVHLLQVLAQAKEPLASRAYASYVSAFQDLRARPAEEHLFYLEMTARQLGDEALAKIWMRNSALRQWSVPWARWSPVSPHRTIPVFSAIYSILVNPLEGRPVIVSGGGDGTVRVWDLATGKAIGEPLRGPGVPVNSVTTSTLEGGLVIVSGGYDGTVRVWNVSTGESTAVHTGSVVTCVLCIAAETLVVASPKGLMAIEFRPAYRSH